MSELDRASLDRTLPPRSGSADWDEVLRGAGAGRERRGRRLVGVVAAVLVLVVGTASAFGTVRDLFGNGPHVERNFFPSEGKRGSFTVRIVFIDSARSHTRGVGGSCLSRTLGTPWLRRASMCTSAGAGGLSE